MRRLLFLFVGVALLFGGCKVAIGQTESAREFQQFHCRITLPGPEFVWVNNSVLPKAQAILRDSSGTMLLLLVQPAPPGNQLNQKEFDRGFLDSSRMEKIDSREITFRGVPCHELRARAAQGGVSGTVTARVFVANGHTYCLQLVSRALPAPEQDKQERIFESFDFMGAPSVPAPRVPAAVDSPAYRFSGRMGEIAGVCILLIVILLAVRTIRRRRQASRS